MDADNREQLVSLLEALADNPGGSPRVVLFSLRATTLDGVGKLDHALGRVRPAVEDDVLDTRQELVRDVFRMGLGRSRNDDRIAIRLDQLAPLAHHRHRGRNPLRIFWLAGTEVRQPAYLTQLGEGF